MTLSVWNLSALIVGYLIALTIGQFIVGPIVDRLWTRYVPTLQRHRQLPAIVGALDIFLFISAYLIGTPEFIAIWVAIKLAGEWSPSKTDTDRPLYHILLIGNGLNIVISVGIALIIQSLIR